jgi:hypothetical protein
MRCFTRLVMLAAMLLGMLGMAALPASAKDKSTYSYDFSAIMPPYACANGQHLIEDFSVHVDGKITYDKDGSVFMTVEDVTQTGKEYLQEDLAKVIYYENEHWKNFTKPNGALTGSGIVMKVTIPGYGMVFKDIGHYVFAWDEAAGHYVVVALKGTHQFFSQEGYPDVWDYSVPCAYLTSLT